ncbi:biotin--[acetyl-CoA-carboxylase] ligase, partial [Hansschlegelia beijingensis]
MSFALGPMAIAAGHSLVAYDTVGSTNTEALALVREGRGPVWVAARSQTDTDFSEPSGILRSPISSTAWPVDRSTPSTV